MNPVLSKIMETGLVETNQGSSLPLHSHLPLLECKLLERWVQEYRPTRLLEIGLAYGISTLAICEGMKDFDLEYYHVIDGFQKAEWHNIGLHNLRMAGFLDDITFHEQRSEIVLPKLLETGLRFDFAFVDGWHSFDQVLLEFYYINRILDVTGIIIFDDAQLRSLTKLFSYIDRYDFYERLPLTDDFQQYLPLKVRRMMGVPESRIVGFRKISEDHRNWDWFEEF